VSGILSSYEDLLADHEIDAVYNPLPNSLHAEWSIRAAEAGKHILCEKPLAATADEAIEMIRAAQRAGVYLVEAYPYRSQPLTKKMNDMLTTGEIGTVRLIRADFGFHMSDESNIRLDPSLKGGSLWDVGCYTVSLATMIGRGRAKRVHASATWTRTGVDKTVAAILEFDSGLIAQISCSFETALHRHATIVGTTAVIQTEYANHTSNPATFVIQTGYGPDGTEKTVQAPGMSGFLAEAESFADLIQHGPPSWNGVANQESVDILVTLEAILLSAQTGQPVEVIGS
jgi:predicted dehydrogenase